MGPSPFRSTFCALSLVCWTLWWSRSNSPLATFSFGWAVGWEKKEMSGQRRRTSLSIWKDKDRKCEEKKTGAFLLFLACSKTSLSLKNPCHWLVGLGFRGWSSISVAEWETRIISSERSRQLCFVFPSFDLRMTYWEIVGTGFFVWLNSPATFSYPSAGSWEACARRRPGDRSLPERLKMRIISEINVVNLMFEPFSLTPEA